MRGTRDWLAGIGRVSAQNSRNVGEQLILWSIRLCLIAWMSSAVEFLRGKNDRALRWWTAAGLLYLGHVAAAFQFRHHWSHAAAVADTARQTRELTGIDWGGGVWFNYALAALWIADLAWRRVGEPPRAWTTGVQAYFLFLAVNGAIVFAAGPVRWISVAALAALAISAVRSKRLFRR